MSEVWEKILEYCTGDGLLDLASSAGIFIVIFVAAVIVAVILAKLVGGALDRSKRVKSTMFRNFCATWTRRLIIILGIVIGLETIGVNMAPIIAGLGIAGFIIGFAVQGTLSNFASGIMLLIYQPFDEGDLVEVDGKLGSVVTLSIVNVILRTPDNKTIILPNSNVWGNAITNFSALDSRRVDFTVSVSYEADLDRCLSLLREHVAAHEKVLKDQEITVEVAAWGDSAIDIVVRPWVATADYWTVFFELQRTMKQLLDANGIEIPFPQRVVYMRQEASGS